MELVRLIDDLRDSGFAPRVVRGDAVNLRVLDITEDSRTAMPGSLFIARTGTQADGRRFAADAVELGAVAVLTDDPGALPDGLDACVIVCLKLPEAVARLGERFYGEPSAKLFVAGITGTNGKTTVAHLAHRLLNAAGVRTGLIGTVEIDDGRERAPAAMTTPPALEVSRTLGVMVESGCRAMVMEVSSHALDQRRVDGVAFDAGVFTNLTGDHLDYHGSMDAYAAAKKRLFGLVDAHGGVSIVNGHDERAGTMTGSRAEFCWAIDAVGAELFDVPMQGEFDEPAWTVRTKDRSGTAMLLEIGGPWGRGQAGGPISSWVELIGAHNAMNTLQAVAVAWHAMREIGIDADESKARIARALTLVTTPRGRLEVVSGDDDLVTVLVDYAHTDDALRHALGAARTVVPEGRRLWAVFGAGGERDRTKRPRMGAVAGGLADRVVVTSDNPRSESPSAIISEIVAGIPEDRRNAMDVQADREKAIAFAVRTAEPGDVVVIAGKGHETEQVLPGPDGRMVRRRFDDRAEAQRTLADRRREAGRA
ncbi:MAG: UDP-N-acetylmuramoyl-L-alanyl-D-glutamate--2,6-diaminopimelate ligase [Planctomycetota bacterium]